MDKVKRLRQFACVLLIISCGTPLIKATTPPTTTTPTTTGTAPTTTGPATTTSTASTPPSPTPTTTGTTLAPTTTGPATTTRPSPTPTTTETLPTAQTTWGLPSNTSLSSGYVKIEPVEETCVPLKKVSDSSNCTEQDILANITVQSFGACVKACLVTSGCVCLAIEQSVKDNFTLGSCVLGNLGTYEGNLEYVLYETVGRINSTNEGSP
ncbi:salivary glue protein Sgs-3-like [Littorina saxatilis]|uniref:salivary glue protein Sgs-3-like n=1 Tax=Littorina saxatilis TaxID=31220 RepID=UPI0038B447D0